MTIRSKNGSYIRFADPIFDSFSRNFVVGISPKDQGVTDFIITTPWIIADFDEYFQAAFLYWSWIEQEKKEA